MINPLTKYEIDSMDCYENIIQDSIIFFPKEKWINWNICLKFENNCVEVTINITSPFDNSKRCQLFIFDKVNKTKIIEAIEKYFRT